MAKKLDEAKAEEIRSSIDRLIKIHGFELVRRVFNRYATDIKTIKNMEEIKRSAEQRIREIDAKLAKRNRSVDGGSRRQSSS